MIQSNVFFFFEEEEEEMQYNSLNKKLFLTEHNDSNQPF
jgi:hypothetical protein